MEDGFRQNSEETDAVAKVGRPHICKLFSGLYILSQKSENVCRKRHSESQLVRTQKINGMNKE